MTNPILSYTSAHAFPVKLLLNDGAREMRPVHIQWIPTNRCNLSCAFCCCRTRNRTHEMEIGRAVQVMDRFVAFGTRAATVSGGGEPLCHPHIEQMIRELHARKIRIGLATNGLLLDRLSQEAIAMLTWCRISHADYRTLDAAYRAVLDRAAEVPIDWAFSYVLSRTPNVEQIGSVVDYANQHAFTHVRIALDRMDYGPVDFGDLRDVLRGRDERVIYQTNESQPATSCLCGYVKPSVTADFRLYLCCGVQYAIKGREGDFPDELCMGSVEDMGRLWNGRREPFRVACDRCYYGTYHAVLSALASEVVHKEFV